MAAMALPAGAAGNDASPSEKGDKARKGNFPLRKRTGTAAFHMSRRAVDCGFEDLEAMSEAQVVGYMAQATWGSTTYMPCPHCGTLDEHYFSDTELRWKCKGCGKRFSVTSGTVLADHKLPLRKILRIAFSWVRISAHRGQHFSLMVDGVSG
jgi:nitrite reductase/ring-hydroxylating ferredoxin subunit